MTRGMKYDIMKNIPTVRLEKVKIKIEENII